MWWWWWAWVVFVIVVFLVPWSYGWGRRGWGPPYPTYYRRRGGVRRGATVAPEPADTDPYDPTVPPMRDRPGVRDDRMAPERRPGDGWTWLADLFWLGALAAIAWAIYLWVT